MKMKHAYAVLLASVVLAGCGANASGPPSHVPTRYQVFGDLTPSIIPDNKSHWPPIAEAFVGQLSYGDAVDIYPIHDRTADSAPLFTGEIPKFDETGTMRDQARAKSELIRVRKRAYASLQKMLSSGNKVDAKVTDVLGAIDRFNFDPSRRNEILMFSDGLQSSDKDLNLERDCLRALDPSQAIVTLAQRRRWRNDTLTGTSVRIVLPAAGPGEVRSCNSTAELRQFYTLLIDALGGRLLLFDTHIGGHSGGRLQ